MTLVGQRLENQSITLVNNQRVNLIQSPITVVSFWASWCGPCMAELPSFIQLHNNYYSKGVNVIGFSLDYTKEDLEKTIDRYEIPFPNALLPDEISQLFGGVYSIPYTVILKNNTVIADVLGYREMAYFESIINKELERSE